MTNTNQYCLKLHQSIKEINADAWDVLTDDTPLLSHAFLLALEQSQSIGEGTGWYPYPLAVYDNNNTLIGAMPLYLKTHSYGEYVFDWAWADAYQSQQMAYYPKLVCAIPFSPVTSARMLSRHQTVNAIMLDAIPDLLTKHQLSSAHILFPDTQNCLQLDDSQWLKRRGVQFRWENKNYNNMNEFLATLSHDKRKKIKQDRKKIAHANVQCKWILGQEATEGDWDFFYDCYCNTYLEHHSSPYLTRAFFSEIAKTLASKILLIMASIDNKPIACTLNFYNTHILYGRYWGSTSFVSGLHFELCYYQAQEFCIANRIQYFEGGAQGEHKLARGFNPRETYSYHKIMHPQFEDAIARFLGQESKGITAYTSELEERTPFKKPNTKE